MGIPNINTLIACSDFVSLISKWRCGPPEPPVFPDRAIISPFLTAISPESGYQFIVNDFFIEEQFTGADNHKLRLLAKNTKGEVYFEDNYNLLFDKLVSDKRFTIEKKSKKISTSLINKIWMMLFVIFLLSLEWFIRKYFGKV